MMYDLLNQINQALEPHTTRTLVARFDLPEQKAKFVLPIVSAFLLIRLRKSLEAGPGQYAIVERIAHLLRADVGQHAPVSTLRVEELENLCCEVLGERNEMVARALSSIVDVDEETGANLRDCVLPMVFVDLCARLEEWEALNMSLSFFQPRHADRLDLLRYLLGPDSLSFDTMGPTGIC